MCTSNELKLGQVSATYENIEGGEKKSRQAQNIGNNKKSTILI